MLASETRHSDRDRRHATEAALPWSLARAPSPTQAAGGPGGSVNARRAPVIISLSAHHDSAQAEVYTGLATVPYACLRPHLPVKGTAVTVKTEPAAAGRGQAAASHESESPRASHESRPHGEPRQQRAADLSSRTH